MTIFPVRLLPLDCLPSHCVSRSSHDAPWAASAGWFCWLWVSMCESILARWRLSCTNRAPGATCAVSVWVNPHTMTSGTADSSSLGCPADRCVSESSHDGLPSRKTPSLDCLTGHFVSESSHDDPLAPSAGWFCWLWVSMCESILARWRLSCTNRAPGATCAVSV